MYKHSPTAHEHPIAHQIMMSPETTLFTALIWTWKEERKSTDFLKIFFPFKI